MLPLGYEVTRRKERETETSHQRKAALHLLCVFFSWHILEIDVKTVHRWIWVYFCREKCLRSPDEAAPLRRRCAGCVAAQTCLHGRWNEKPFPHRTCAAHAGGLSALVLIRFTHPELLADSTQKYQTHKTLNDLSSLVQMLSNSRPDFLTSSATNSPCGRWIGRSILEINEGQTEEGSSL